MILHLIYDTFLIARNYFNENNDLSLIYQICFSVRSNEQSTPNSNWPNFIVVFILKLRLNYQVVGINVITDYIDYNKPSRKIRFSKNKHDQLK